LDGRGLENAGKPEQVTFGLPKNLVEALGAR
jgi:hypothetical protein